MGRNNSVERFINEILRIAPEETVEFMCHPGFPGKSWDDFNTSTDREHEMEIMCDNHVKETLATSLVQLSSFEDL
jgi:predicted glycoside hydrolase/deacetylase ChbG (UPF0249 family)